MNECMKIKAVWDNNDYTSVVIYECVGKIYFGYRYVCGKEVFMNDPVEEDDQWMC